MNLGTREHEGEGNGRQVTKKTQTVTGITSISILLEAFIHLDSDGVQAVSNLLQLRVAFTNLLTPEKTQILEFQRKIAKIKNQKANAK